LCRHQEILSLCHSRALDCFENFISLGFTCPKGYFLIAQATALLCVVVLIFYNCLPHLFKIFVERKWGLGGFAPDKLCLGEAPPRAVGVQTLCLPRFRGCPVRSSALIKQVTADDNHTVALLTLTFAMQTLIVVGNVSRRLSEELPFVLFLFRHTISFHQIYLRGEE